MVLEYRETSLKSVDILICNGLDYRCRLSLSFLFVSEIPPTHNNCCIFFYLFYVYEYKFFLILTFDLHLSLKEHVSLQF